MNCRQARSLFSARVDGELSSLEDRELQQHLDRCAKGCAERWASFETTVRLVHGLPTAEADPSFVGQVLDRIRAYEAGHLRPRVVLRPSFGARLRALLPDRVFVVPVPVRFATVGALGIALGFVLASGLDWRASRGLTPLTASSVQTDAPASAVFPAGRVGTPEGQPPRPFADLVDDLSVTRGTRTRDDSMAQSPLPANPTNGAPAVRVVKGDERPQIVF